MVARVAKLRSLTGAILFRSKKWAHKIIRPHKLGLTPPSLDCHQSCRGWSFSTKSNSVDFWVLSAHIIWGKREDPENTGKKTAKILKTKQKKRAEEKQNKKTENKKRRNKKKQKNSWVGEHFPDPSPPPDNKKQKKNFENSWDTIRLRFQRCPNLADLFSRVLFSFLPPLLATPLPPLFSAPFGPFLLLEKCPVL